MVPETGTAAACSNEIRDGLRTSLSAGATVSSANEPRWASPITSSPRANSVTADPTASTVPATSQPRIRIFGRLHPSTGRAMYGFPAMMCHTSGPAPAARTRISTSCSPTCGSSTSRNSSTSASPYRSCTIAFMVTPVSP